MADTIKVSIELADAAAQAALSNFIAKGDKADKGIKKLGDTGKNSFNDITIGIGKSIGVYEIFEGSLLANLATKAFETMASAAGQLFTVLVTDGIRAAQDSQAALNALNVALAQSGNYSEEASRGFQDFAEQIQATTAFEDDAIIKNTALLASLTNLDNNGLKRATSAAIELSAALGKDLQTTTEAVAKAANGNFTALNKMGIQFDKSGTQAQNFESALKAVEDKLGGTAASKINTYAGAIEQAKNNFGNLQEEIGNLVIQNPVFIETIKAANEVLFNVTNGVKTASGAMQTLGQAFLYTVALTGQVVQVFNGLATAAVIVFDSVVSVATRAMSLLVAPFAAFSETAQKYYAAYVQQSRDAAVDITDTLTSGGPLAGVVAAIDKIGEGAALGFQKLSDGVTSTVAPVNSAKKALTGFNEEQIKARDESKKYVEALAKQAEDTKTAYETQLQLAQAYYDQKVAMDTEANDTNYQMKLAREQNFMAERQVLLDENLAAEIQRVNNSTASDLAKDQAKLALQAKYQADSEKLKADFLKKDKAIQEQADKTALAQRTNTLNLFAGLANSNNQTLATIGKAAGLAQIAIATPVAVSEAFEFGTTTGGPALGFAFGAVAAAAMAEQAAKLTGLSFETGGIVPGNSFSGDRISANVNSGEMILNRQQQAQLFDVANGKAQAGSGITRADLAAFAREIMATPIRVVVDGRELIGAFRDQVSGGRSFT